MSLTVNALRKLQQSGAFPEPPKPFALESQNPAERTEPVAEPSISSPPAGTSVNVDSTGESETHRLPASEDSHDISQASECPTLFAEASTDPQELSDELEPPISTEEEDETGDSFPHPWDEELTLPEAKVDFEAEPFDRNEPDSSPPAAEPSFDLHSPQLDQPSDMDEGCNQDLKASDSDNLPDSELAFEDQSIAPEASSHSSEVDETFDATNHAHGFSRKNPHLEIEQTELFDKNEESDGYDNALESNPEIDTTSEPKDDSSEWTRSQDNESGDLEPLITESINSLERILRNEDAESAYGLSDESNLDSESLNDERPTSPSTEDTNTVHSSDLENDSHQAIQKEIIRYTPVIETIDFSIGHESSIDRLDAAEQLEQQNPVENPEEEESDASLKSDALIAGGEDETSSVETRDSETLPLNADLPTEPVSDHPFPIPSLASYTGQAVEPTDYENEIRENLAKPDCAQSFTNLCNQLHTRLHYKLPNSLLMITPLKTGRLSDTLAYLSFMLERDGRNIIMIDANLTDQALTRRFECVGMPGICDVLSGSMQPHEVIRPTSIPGIQFIPCGDDITGISRIPNSTTPEAVSEMVQAWSGNNCHLLCDVGSLDSTLALPFCVVFEAVLCVVSMQNLELAPLRKAIQLLREYEVPVVGTVTTDGQI